MIVANIGLLTLFLFRESATWPVPVLAFLFLVLGSGNILTMSLTIFSKIRETQLGHFKLRFTRLDKYFWTHKRSPGPEAQRRWFTQSAERVARKRSESGRDIQTILEQIDEKELVVSATDDDEEKKDN